MKNSIEVPRDVPCFVLTNLPEKPYLLGVDSKLKGDIINVTLDNEFSEIDFNSLY